MQGTIISYDSTGNHHTKLEYNITPLKLQNKCQVYLKISLICDGNFPDGLAIYTSNTLFCTINSIDVNYNLSELSIFIVIETTEKTIKLNYRIPVSEL